MRRKAHDSITAMVGRIHDIVVNADSADELLADMAAMLDADKAVLVRLAQDRRRDIAIARHGMDRELVGRILSERTNPDTFLAHDSRWQSGAIATDQDCVRSEARRRETEYYRRLLAPNDIEHTLLGIIDSSELHHVLLWFHRGRKRGPFGKAERALLGELMPHWQRAIHHKVQYDMREGALAAAGIILDQSPFGLYMIGRNDQVLWTNAAAKKQCAAGAGIGMRKQRLVFSDRKVRRDLEAMIAAIRQGGREDDPRMQPISFQKTDGNGSYQLGMRRLPLPQRRGSLTNRNVISLFVYDTGERIQLSVAVLKSLYDLTDAEARVCELLYKSRNLPEAAKTLGISINTAKTHLMRSFRKVGVQSQSELVRRLNSQLYLT